mgnify:CR=1 FL=1
MRKLIGIVFATAVIVLAVVFFCNRASRDMVLNKELEDLLAQGEKEIDLTTLTNFEWDAVSAFGPYTTNDQIEESMGIRFKGDNGGINVLEDRFLLVFANGKYAVKTVVLSRKYGEFKVKDEKLLIVY